MAACRNHAVIIRCAIWLGQAIGHSSCSRARTEQGCESRNYPRHSSCSKSAAKDIALPQTLSCPHLVFHRHRRLLTWLGGCKNEYERSRRSQLLQAVIFIAGAVAHSASNFAPFRPHRKERAGKRLSTSPSSSATSRRWSYCSTRAPPWTPPCLTAARPCIWRWGDATPPSLTSSASLALTWCCGTWRMKQLWIWPTAMMM